MLSAKTKIAAKQYSDALELLSQADPLSTCSKEANELITVTGKKADEQQKKEWDLALKIYSDQLALENHRIDAIKDVTVTQSKQKSHRSRKSPEEE